MVEFMESWFLADHEALKAFYGQGFHESALPRNPQVEQVSKRDIENDLQSATKDTSKGPYRKKHSFKILGKLNHEKVMNASPYAKRFIEALKALTS